MSINYTHTIFCDRCGKPLGEVTEKEFDAIFSENFSWDLCFDCDPESASTVPSLFWQWQDGDKFILGDKCLEVTLPLNSSGYLFDVSHTHMSAGVHPSLSSSTYFNTHPNQEGERKQETVNDARFCPSCPEVYLYSMADGKWCPSCGYVRPYDELILPSWIVNQPPIGKVYGDGRKGCPDCDTVISLGGVGYCSYHQDLAETYFDRLAKAAGNV